MPFNKVYCIPERKQEQMQKLNFICNQTVSHVTEIIHKTRKKKKMVHINLHSFQP